MSLHDLILKRRTIRRFKQEKIVTEVLKSLVDSARLAPSAMNMQPLEYIIVQEPDVVNKVFQNTRWAGYLPDDTGRPAPNEQPVAYIAVLVNKSLKSAWTGHDIGAAVENMILFALAEGIGSCWLGSVNRAQVCEMLNVPDSYELDSVLALGIPAEEPRVVDFKDSQKYYKDTDGTLNVPKRDLNHICHLNVFKRE